MDSIGPPARRGTGAMSPSERATTVPPRPRERLSLARADLADARERLDGAERKAARHLAWALLGLSPAALVPFLGLLVEGNLTLLAVLLVTVPFVEGWRYRRAKREADRLQMLVNRLRLEHPDPKMP